MVLPLAPAPGASVPLAPGGKVSVPVNGATAAGGSLLPENPSALEELED